VNYNLHANLAQAPLAYPRCGAINAPAPDLGAGLHAASARYEHCGLFLRRVSTHLSSEHQTRRQQDRQQAITARPPSAAPLAYVAVLGDMGPVPSTMVEASASIHALVRGDRQP